MTCLIAPLAPHIAEELWSRMGNEGSVAFAPFPEADPDMLVEATVTMVVQVNGKVKERLEVAADISEDEARQRAIEAPKVVAAIGDKTVRKAIVRPPKLVNLVIG